MPVTWSERLTTGTVINVNVQNWERGASCLVLLARGLPSAGELSRHEGKFSFSTSCMFSLG